MRSFLHWIQNHMYLVDIIKLTLNEFAQKPFFENPRQVQGAFLTVPPHFQYRNEKQVAANQDYFFKKFSM